MKTLKERLVEWKSWDGAMFELAVILGIIPDGQESWLANKGLFWSAGPMDDFLTGALQDLVKLGYLEYREEPEQEYRWKE